MSLHRGVPRKNTKLHKLNEPDNHQLPFSQVDINYAELLYHIKVNGTQREMDLVYVSNLFHEVWSELHVSLAVLKENVSESRENNIRKLYDALKRLYMTHLLTDGLPKKWVKWLESK